MKELDNYISELTSFADTLQETVVGIVIEDEESILDVTIKKRLLDTGFDAVGDLIGDGEYSALAKQVKKQRGQESGHFTLFHDGGFHGGMLFEKRGKDLFLNSRDYKTSELTKTYGQEILGLNETETTFVIRWNIDPELQKIINKQTTFIEL